MEMVNNSMGSGGPICEDKSRFHMVLGPIPTAHVGAARSQESCEGGFFIVSTSKLQKQVSKLLSVHLGQYTVRENVRPDWLATSEGARLELDFYIEELETAIEVQGAQHYIYIPHFHQNYDGFRQRVAWDTTKRQKCQRRGVLLIEVDTYENALEVILGLADKTKEHPMHPNAIRQAETKYIISKGKQKSFSEYPSTISKHLRRIHKVLLKTKRNNGKITERNKERLQISLRAIRQYQEVKSSKEVKDMTRRDPQPICKRDALALALIERDGYCCQECGTSEDLTIDHIVALSKGGTDDLDNLRWLCRKCNSRKGA